MKLRREVKKVVFFAVCLEMISFSFGTLPATEIEALCDISTLWGCNEDCQIGCNVCGTICDYSEVVSHVSELTVTNKPVTYVPASISNLTYLSFLQLDYDQIITLPETFGSLVSLTELYVTNNQLSILPSSFGDLTKLRILDLSANNLTFIPNYFANFILLEYLDLYNNDFTEVPDIFDKLTSLKNITLEENHLTTLPITLLQSLSSFTSLNFDWNYLICSELASHNPTLSFCEQSKQYNCTEEYDTEVSCNNALACYWNASDSTCYRKMKTTMAESSSKEEIEQISSSFHKKHSISSSENSNNNNNDNPLLSSSINQAKQQSSKSSNTFQEIITIIIDFADSITDTTELKKEISDLLDIDLNRVLVELISSTQVKVTIIGESLSVIQQNANQLIDIINNQNCNY